MAGKNNFPKLHNAMWPGLVGKGPDSEPPIDLDTMIALTANAEVNGVKSINIPKIGSGIGGLKWDDVLSVITKAGEESSVVLRVCI